MHVTVGIPHHILAIDLGPIQVKAMMEGGATLEEATLGARELRRFYALHHKYPDEALSPSKLMDKIWHLHILDTMYYPDDCEAMFGHHLHHFPYLGLRGKDDAILLERTFDRTKEFYRLEFGENMPQAFEGTVCGGGCASERPKPKPGDPTPPPEEILAESYCKPASAERCGVDPTDPKCSDSVEPKCCGNALLLPTRPSLKQYLATLQ